MARSDQVMWEKIEDSYRYYSEADRRAIAVYLQSLPPVAFDPYEAYGEP